MTATQGRRSDPYGDASGLRRWWVHLGLIVSCGLALLILVAHGGLAVHLLAGSFFAGLVAVHLVQRRRTVRTLAVHLTRVVRARTPRGRLAASDAVLAFLAANVVASGIADWIAGRAVMLPVRSLTGIPMPALNWHTSTSLLLVAYLVGHVVRRRTRLRHSQVR
jgi:hypothetical protein